MAKRFTDTSKYRKAWFRALPPRLKCAWDFLCLECDHAGIWSIDLESLRFHIGEEVTLEELVASFEIVRVGDDKLFLPTFFEFQYGTSKEGFRAKQSAVEILRKYALVDEFGDLIKCPGVSPDTPSISKSKSKSSSKSKRPEINFDFDSVYSRFPKRKGNQPGEARKALELQLETDQDANDFGKAVDNYAAHCISTKCENQFIKRIEFFVGSVERPFWRAWIDVTPEPNSASDSDSWERSASLVVTGLKKFPNWLESEIDVQRLLGDELFLIARKANTTELRRIPAGPFYVQNIIARLKDAQEVLNAQKTGN